MISGILFNTVDLTTLSPYVFFTYRDIHDLPTRTIIDYKKARASGHAFVAAEYEQGMKVLTGFIAAPDRGTLETARDTLLAAVQGSVGTLDIPEAGGTRRYYATLSNFILTDKEGGGFDTFTMTFTQSDPFGYATSATTASLGTVTATPTTYSYTFNGSVDALPAITLTLTSFTGTGSRTLTVTNPTTGKSISITRTWTAADVMVVDLANKVVTINGIVTAFDGGLLNWPVGSSQSIQISDTFTARSIPVTLSYIPRYA